MVVVSALELDVQGVKFVDMDPRVELNYEILELNRVIHYLLNTFYTSC